MDISDTIRSRRLALGLSQSELAKRANVSLRQLALSGEDLFRLGVTRRATGEWLDTLLGLVMDGACENTAEALSAVVRQRLDERAAAAPAPKKKPRRRTKDARRRTSWGAPAAAANRTPRRGCSCCRCPPGRMWGAGD